MRKVCGVVFWLYVAAALASLALVPLSAAGAFGITPDPLSGVYAVLLSTPWSYLGAALMSDDVWWNLALMGFGMAINAAIIRLLCSLLARTAAPQS